MDNVYRKANDTAARQAQSKGRMCGIVGAKMIISVVARKGAMTVWLLLATVNNTFMQINSGTGDAL